MGRPRKEFKLQTKVKIKHGTFKNKTGVVTKLELEDQIEKITI